MPISVTDVKSPAGDVDGSVWFPALSGGAVDTLLTGYIADAYTKTSDDEAAEQWVYYRAATAVADRLGMSASTSTTLSIVDEGSKTTTVGGNPWAYWAAKAAAYLAAFEDEIAEVVDDPLGGFSVLTSLRHG